MFHGIALMQCCGVFCNSYMTARQARTARRAAERLASKQAKHAETAVHADAAAAAAQAECPNRSTGPRTPVGKSTSRWNSFKHGLYAKQLVVPGEDPTELDSLRSSLRAEHQPANTTEEILVNEIAEQYWRLRRMRRYEAHGMASENFAYWFEKGLLALVARQMGSAERGMHKAMTTLRRLQLDRGFVPSKEVSDEAASFSEPKTQARPEHPAAQQPEFVPQIQREELDWVPEPIEEDLDYVAPQAPDYASFSPPHSANAA